ncbi:T9SS type A sorting domain-containing protein [Hymenobacter negativus]|uniref:T9SS type A sorting domain-containing protein n=1 Tax=Hymenobacter negativus TaxID=2795026 RepID=A0ABS0Q547_9BACT|nr:T9SS type A sorting domain-containing protein [Hymenobacter negativus]MBH8557791.1 T9SS type A sorting domain-containing protein [Hymenobacter negativus]
MKKKLLPALLMLLLVLGLCGSAHAATPPAPGRSLAEALNPDGTLKTGLNGSFDARAFRMHTAPDGQPVFRPAGVAGAGDERWQDGFGLPNGTDAEVLAVLSVGNTIYIGGSFTVVGTVPARCVAKWDGTSWSGLGAGVGDLSVYGGVDGGVYALAVAANGDVYAGGKFTQASGVPATNVARWNGTAWSALGAGLYRSGGGASAVYALLAGPGGAMYAGGNFTQAGGVATQGIAQWNGTAWSFLGTTTYNGVNSNVNSLALAANGDLYVGGQFTQAGAVNANRIARWNGTTWSALGAGIGSVGSDMVAALAVASNGDLYAAGSFIRAGSVTANAIAKWNGTTWSALIANPSTGQGNGVNSYVYSLALAPNGDLYVGGIFTQAGLTAVSRVARWTGTTWVALGTGVGTGLGVEALAVAANGDVYAGGQFGQAGGVPTENLARWTNSAWASAPGTSQISGVNASVSALAIAPNGDVYVGGQFGRAGGVAANAIAKWNGTAWSALGTGMATSGTTAPRVSALAVAANGDVYAGGSFTRAGGVAVSNVAKWNGTAWSALGTGMATNNASAAFVTVLTAAPNGDIYAGGNFVQIGGVTANFVARWNGTTWNSLGTGTANGVFGTTQAIALAPNADVYVAGYINQAGGVAVNYVAKWNGTNWSALGTGATNGANSTILALAVATNGDLYAAGSFNQAGGVAANRVARWNGSTWSPLGTGLGTLVSDAGFALAVAPNGDLYAAGQFTQSGGVATNYIARWNGTSWSALGTGLNNAPADLVVGANGKLYAGGIFTTTGDGRKASPYFAIYDPAATLSTTTARATPAAQLYPNPAHGTATLRLPAGAPRQPLTLTDALGRPVRRYPAPTSAEAELDLRGLPAGTYVVRCGQLSQRLVVE